MEEEVAEKFRAWDGMAWRGGMAAGEGGVYERVGVRGSPKNK